MIGMYLVFRSLSVISLALAMLTTALPRYSIYFVVAIIVIILLLCLVEWFVPKTIKINGEKTNLVLEYGDLLKKTNGIIVIPVDRNYNTTVDDIIISSNTLHGKFINNIVRNKDAFVSELSSALKSEPDEKGAFETQQPGHVVPVTLNGCTYYLLALSKLDQNNKAHCTPEEYAKAIETLMGYIDTNFNGKKIYMPLIGGGLSDVFGSINDTESLQILVSLIKLSQNARIDEIHIIVYKHSKHHALIQMVN